MADQPNITRRLLLSAAPALAAAAALPAAAEASTRLVFLRTASADLPASPPVLPPRERIDRAVQEIAAAMREVVGDEHWFATVGLDAKGNGVLRNPTITRYVDEPMMLRNAGTGRDEPYIDRRTGKPAVIRVTRHVNVDL